MVTSAKIENGIVSVNAYGIVGQLTFPLLFKVFKPKHRLKAGDTYQTKLQLAQSIVEELVAFGFKIELVLADSLYGKSHRFVRLLDRLKLTNGCCNSLESWGMDAGRRSS